MNRFCVALAALAPHACTACGAGTSLYDKTCTVDGPTFMVDTDARVDSDVSSDTDAPGDTDLKADTDAVTARCAPPEIWRSDIPADLYTAVPYPSSSDALLQHMVDGTSANGGGSSADIVVDGTVVAVVEESLSDIPTWMTFVADGHVTLPVRSKQPSAIGDKVAFVSARTRGSAEYRSVEDVSDWIPRSTGNPVYVAEVQAAGLTYLTTFSQRSHLTGELTGVSSLDCGLGFTCFRLEHDGRSDLVRLPTDNTFALDADYAGGLCAEVIAPAGIRQTVSSSAQFLDVLKPAWMRTWSAP